MGSLILYLSQSLVSRAHAPFRSPHPVCLQAAPSRRQSLKKFKQKLLGFLLLIINNRYVKSTKLLNKKIVSGPAASYGRM